VLIAYHIRRVLTRLQMTVATAEARCLSKTSGDLRALASG
jgi:hypothetical protein